MEDAGKANLPAQATGVNDLVAVSVYRSPELTRTVRVDTDGTIALPLLNEPVRAEGLKPAQLEKAIAAAEARRTW
jgi:polysaccharide export outer membrane protein